MVIYKYSSAKSAIYVQSACGSSEAWLGLIWDKDENPGTECPRAPRPKSFGTMVSDGQRRPILFGNCTRDRFVGLQEQDIKR